ncbi:hypothetical protein FQA39_LY11477 [Lamprigera yunnana]|nr:hypothetical protein FQA39_LY11477 [Lamprigera yunnana]
MWIAVCFLLITAAYEGACGFTSGAPCNVRNTALIETRGYWRIPREPLQCVDITSLGTKSTIPLFPGLILATTLYADHMRLTAVPVFVLNAVRRVELIDLSGNLLTDLDKNVFLSLIHLQPEVIQPLFDLADPNYPVYKEQKSAQTNGVMMQNTSSISEGSTAMKTSPIQSTSQVPHASDANTTGIANYPHPFYTLAQLEQLHKLLQRQDGDSNMKTSGGQLVRFYRKRLDFHYGDEEDENHVNPSPKLPSNNNSLAIQTVGSLLSNPQV